MDSEVDAQVIPSWRKISSPHRHIVHIRNTKIIRGYLRLSIVVKKEMEKHRHYKTGLK